MKRHNLTEASNLPWCNSWLVICYLLVLCFFSCACKNKTNLTQPAAAEAAAMPSAENLPDALLPNESGARNNTYDELVRTIKSNPEYSLFGEFLERGKYSDVLLRKDSLEFYILVPSNNEIKKLDNATMTQLIYPDVPDQSNLAFLLNHMAFNHMNPDLNQGIRTMTGRVVKLDELHVKKINIGGRQYPVSDEARIESTIRVFFIENYLN